MPLAKERGSENAWLKQAVWVETTKEHARTNSKRNDEKLFTKGLLNCAKGLHVGDKE